MLEGSSWHRIAEPLVERQRVMRKESKKHAVDVFDAHVDEDVLPQGFQHPLEVGCSSPAMFMRTTSTDLRLITAPPSPCAAERLDEFAGRTADQGAGVPWVMPMTTCAARSVLPAAPHAVIVMCSFLSTAPTEGIGAERHAVHPRETPGDRRVLRFCPNSPRAPDQTSHPRCRTHGRSGGREPATERLSGTASASPTSNVSVELGRRSRRSRRKATDRAGDHAGLRGRQRRVSWTAVPSDTAAESGVSLASSTLVEMLALSISTRVS